MNTTIGQTIITVQCSTRPFDDPELDAYFAPRRWMVRITRESLDRALASNGQIVRVATYQPDGEKTAHMLQRLPCGLREAWERKHGSCGMLHISHIVGDDGNHLTA